MQNNTMEKSASSRTFKEAKTRTTKLKLPKELHEWLKSESDKNLRTITGQILSLMEQSLSLDAEKFIVNDSCSQDFVYFFLRSPNSLHKTISKVADRNGRSFQEQALWSIRAMREANKEKKS